MSLTLSATLIGKAKTSSEHGHLQVTLKIGQQNLYLTLLPEQAGMFPDLVQTTSHPTERKQQAITYNSGPSYVVTIAEAPVAGENEKLLPATVDDGPILSDESEPIEEEFVPEPEPLPVEEQ